MSGVESIVRELPFWKSLSPDERRLVEERSALRGFSVGQVIDCSDASCMGVVFIVSGGLRASLLSEEGREETLFRLVSGECCVTTASCVIRQITFDTCITATEDSRLLVVPATVCDHLVKTNVHFKVFMLEVEAERYSQVINVMQQLMFKRLDQRLAEYLVMRCEATGKLELKITQEELARDINSAREAVARVLYRLSDAGFVKMRRGRIFVLDLAGLKALR